MHRTSLKHMFKIDPAKNMNDEQIRKLAQSNTDGIVIGGTDGITLENTKAIYERFASYPIPIYQEVSNVDAVLPNCEGYFIPLVLNATDPYWLLQAHQQAIKSFWNWIPWDRCYVEGYIVLNENSKVAKLTKANTDLTHEDVLAYARLADRLLQLPYLYIEYSGSYGDPILVRKVKQTLRSTTLIYGGGISNVEQAEEMGKFADLIIVGNAIYENFEEALTTVKAKYLIDAWRNI